MVTTVQERLGEGARWQVIRECLQDALASSDAYAAGEEPLARADGVASRNWRRGNRGRDVTEPDKAF